MLFAAVILWSDYTEHGRRLAGRPTAAVDGRTIAWRHYSHLGHQTDILQGATTTTATGAAIWKRWPTTHETHGGNNGVVRYGDSFGRHVHASGHANDHGAIPGWKKFTQFLYCTICCREAGSNKDCVMCNCRLRTAASPLLLDSQAGQHSL